jgi:putative membrane protein
MMKQAILAGAVVMGLAAAPVFAADEAWMMKVAKGGMAEVELGKLASEKGTTDAVKNFGKRMADDHSKANDELKTLAANKKVTLPSDLSAEDKALRDRLTKLSGHAFDQAYIKAMVADHVKDVSAFKMEAKSGADADVKAWAAKTLPTLEDHLKMAREASGAVVGTSGTKKMK